MSVNEDEFLKGGAKGGPKGVLDRPMEEESERDKKTNKRKASSHAPMHPSIYLIYPFIPQPIHLTIGLARSDADHHF